MYVKYPTICNICGSSVKLISNKQIYGQSYGSGYAYVCTNCGARVGTHKGTKIALGILSDSKTRKLRMECHSLFDLFWKGKNQSTLKRYDCYNQLAKVLKINITQCHFGYFDYEQLRMVRKILRIYSKVVNAVDFLSHKNPQQYIKFKQQLTKHKFDLIICKQIVEQLKQLNK